MKAKLLFDTSLLERQIDELKTAFGAFGDAMLEGFASSLSSELANKVQRLISDIDFGEAVSTVRADGTVEICHRLRLGRDFERLLTTLRASELNG